MEVDNSSSSTSKFDSCPVSTRQRFTIELRPGETTIVSWKRLIKDAHKAEPPLTQETQKVQVALDEYFQDEKAATKHNDFTDNKGKSKQLNEPTDSTEGQLKKRKKYIPKALGEKTDDHVPNKHAKLGHARPKVAAKKLLLGKQPSSLSQNFAASSDHYHDRKSQNPSNSPTVFSRKKLADSSIKSEYSFYAGIPNKDASVLNLNSKDTEKQRIGIAHCRSLGNKLKDENKLSGAIDLRYEDKNASKKLEPQVNRILTDTSEFEFSTNVWQREKNGINGLPDLNIPASPTEPMKMASYLKDVSSLRPKGSSLERAIRELEKVVAESRPPNVEVQEADTSSIAIKRRLPREVKQKLAKVARLASSQGKISNELVDRLMSILGHLVQLRTLKRNLREMVLLGLSAKREKADRFQQIKLEVTEMIKLQAFKQSDGAADNFQEAFGSEEKRIHREKFSMNSALEDKMCDLYDLYIQGMDEDKGPQIRKLYTELAELWPIGVMDSLGIKKAIFRAKDRRRASHGDEKAQEKLKNKKLPGPSTDGIIRGEVSSMAQPQAFYEKTIAETNTHSSLTTDHHHHAIAMRTSSCKAKGSNTDLHKQERLEKLAYPASREQPKQQQAEPESSMNKSSWSTNKESLKSQKRTVGYPDGLSNQLAAPSNSGRPC
ncbi:ubinuclein-1-like isoform X2 [Pistacia vera]|uniref:ubinuclein-1-like isoform X2 n=1 Tax=Pistacia vera TaxID=55513 RepID=UPI0012637F01|nr:ubinuclein-1-like isoform X2 [Pistacia vera]